MLVIDTEATGRNYTENGAYKITYDNKGNFVHGKEKM